MTLRDTLDTRDNALNFVRLVLAGLVIVSHAWPLGGFGHDPGFGDLTLGSWAVAGFFAISGYLVTGSRMRLGMRQFALRRALRIYPGFWACLLVVAFVFAPLSAWATGTPFDLSRAARFLWWNVSTVLGQMDIGRELDEVPVPGVWDGSLWTLTHELWCYVITGLMLCWGVARRDVTRTTVVVFVALISFNVAGVQAGVSQETWLGAFLRLAAYFAAGSLLWSVSDRLRVNLWYVASAACVLLVLALAGVADLLGALPLAYLVLAFGAWCPVRWGVGRDLSYGVYVYAWPVQQVLALAGVQRFGLAVFIVSAVALVGPFAWLSWTFVERPALKLVPHRSSVVALHEALLDPAG